MQIILEGVSRCGKNTAARYLSDRLGLTYWDNEHNTNIVVRKDFHSVVYLESQIFQSFDNFVKTRYAVSYCAFREFYKEACLPFKQLEESTQDNALCFYITTVYENYVERGGKRSKKDYSELYDIFIKYLESSKHNWHVIENNGTIEEFELKLHNILKQENLIVQ